MTGIRWLEIATSLFYLSHAAANCSNCYFEHAGKGLQRGSLAAALLCRAGGEGVLPACIRSWCSSWTVPADSETRECCQTHNMYGMGTAAGIYPAGVLGWSLILRRAWIQISRSWDLFSKEDLVMMLREHRNSSCWIMALLWANAGHVWRKAK